MIPKKRIFISLLSLCLFVSCGKKDSEENDVANLSEAEEGCPEDETIVDSLSAEFLPLVALPSRQLSIKVNSVNFTSSQNVKIKQAIILLEKVVNSYEFRERVFNHHYLGQAQFASTNLSNPVVYQKILSGKEQLSFVEDQTLNLEVRPYYTWRSVVAYTTPQSNLVYFNTKYLTNYTAADISKTLMHEWLHKIGFNHDYSATSRRPYSVPYGIGEITKILAKAP